MANDISEYEEILFPFNSIYLHRLVFWISVFQEIPGYSNY